MTQDTMHKSVKRCKSMAYAWSHQRAKIAWWANRGKE